jgi:hypothetical protein
MTTKRWGFWLLLVITLGMLHVSANAQCTSTQGEPVVYGSCGGPTFSSAYLDADK